MDAGFFGSERIAMRCYVFLAGIGLAVSGCGTTAAPVAVATSADVLRFQRLLGLMQQRLALMHDVARSKWARKAAIDDPDREAALLVDVAEQAKAVGLDADLARRFFRAQIEAAKIVQRSDFERWAATPPDPNSAIPDLARDLRPRIDAINRDLVKALADVESKQRDNRTAAAEIASGERILAGADIPAEARAAAIAPLLRGRD